MANQFEYQELGDQLKHGLQSKQVFERTRNIVNDIDHKPHTGFRVLRDERGLVFLQHVQFVVDCNDPEAGETEQRGRKFYISTYMTDEEVVRTCLLSIKVFEHHEAHEWFRYKGDRYLNPHPEGARDGTTT